MSSLSTLLSDWLMWALGGLATLLAAIGVPAGTIMKRNRDRSKRNERALYGDGDDPNTDGVLKIAAETRESVKQLEQRMDTQHRELKSILEEKT